VGGDPSVPACVPQERAVQDGGSENVVLQYEAPCVMATEAAARQELFAKGSVVHLLMEDG